MQISTREVHQLQKRAEATRPRPEIPPASVAELAARSGVDLEEVRRFTEAALMADEDPIRERRVRELARRIAQGTYSVAAEDMLEMAERRHVADRAADF